MGNCVETCKEKEQGEEMQQQQEERERGSGFVEESGFGKGGIRVKIVLTKEELEWFMHQLNENKEGKRLEDVFREIEKGRGKLTVEGWKPSLESIMESPEVIEMER